MRYTIFLTKTKGYVVQEPYGLWTAYDDAKKALLLDIAEGKAKWSLAKGTPKGTILFSVSFKEVTN